MSFSLSLTHSLSSSLSLSLSRSLHDDAIIALKIQQEIEMELFKNQQETEMELFKNQQDRQMSYSKSSKRERGVGGKALCPSVCVESRQWSYSVCVCVTLVNVAVVIWKLSCVSS